MYTGSATENRSMNYRDIQVFTSIKMSVRKVMVVSQSGEKKRYSVIKEEEETLPYAFRAPAPKEGSRWEKGLHLSLPRLSLA